MMRFETHEEDPNVNIVLWSEMITGDDKGNLPDESGWVHITPGKEAGFDLECINEMFMEAKKIFDYASTSWSQDRLSEEVYPSMLTTFLGTCMKLLCDSEVMEGLQELINKCDGKEGALEGHHTVWKIGKHKTRRGREMRLTVQIGDYEMEQVILNLGLDANVLPK